MLVRSKKKIVITEAARNPRMLLISENMQIDDFPQREYKEKMIRNKLRVIHEDVKLLTFDIVPDHSRLFLLMTAK